MEYKLILKNGNSLISTTESGFCHNDIIETGQINVRLHNPWYYSLWRWFGGKVLTKLIEI